MRRKIIAGNWKMNKGIAESARLACEVASWSGKFSNKVDIVICPTFASLGPVAKAIEGTGVCVGAQDCYFAQQGAFTGELNPELIRDAGASYCIIGHSERRTLMGETDAAVNLKVRAALASGLKPIICIGETLEERKAGGTINIVSGQLMRAFAGISEVDAESCVIAYEPVWAIGTGLNASADDAQAVCAAIRRAVCFIYGPAAADSVRIQYGGSVKSDNIAGFMSMPDIDGALVGGASLKSEEFERITGAAAAR